MHVIFLIVYFARYTWYMHLHQIYLKAFPNISYLLHKENRKGDRKKEIWCDPFERFTRRRKVLSTWSESGIFHESSALFLTESFSALRDWFSRTNARRITRKSVRVFARSHFSGLCGTYCCRGVWIINPTLYTSSLSLMSREGWTRSGGRYIVP